MIAPPHCFKPVLSFSLLLLYAVSRPVYPQAQTPPPGQKQQAEPTIRVKVGLVQTDVMVFDRQGHFVPDLKLDQFELRVDGKVQPISFMELVSAGSLHDQEIWAKEEGKPAPQEPAAASSNPGRTLLFFVDDWHLSADSVMRSRAALTDLINLSMSPKDRVAIFAASGQLGTTQELTGDKNAVLASLERFNFKSAGVEDLAWPPMTEGQAFLIEQKDQDLRDLRFEENNEERDLLLKKVGERVETFFHDFPNTVSKEQIRQERSNLSTGIKNSVTQNFNYSFYPDKDGYFWEETRMDSKGRPLRNDQISGFSFLTWGFAGMCMLFHPRHQFGSRFRYLGKQISGSHAEVIAFAQKPESGDVLGTYLGETMVTPALIMYQGLVWVDPETYQIVRMRTDLLAPRNDIGLSSQTSEIWFSEVRFKSIPQTFWLPREVVVTSVILGQMCRNTHRYSDHQVFTVETQEKIEPPQKKKEARSIG